MKGKLVEVVMLWLAVGAAIATVLIWGIAVATALVVGMTAGLFMMLILNVSDGNTYERLGNLQAAVDTAWTALNGSAYVGGPTEREAFRIALHELGPHVTQHKGQGEVRRAF